MLKENDEPRRESNLNIWHEAGYTGKGVNILVCDFNGKIYDHMKDYAVLIDPEGVMSKEARHNTFVAQVVHEAAPDATVYVTPWTHSSKEITDWLRENPRLIDIAGASLTTPVTDDFNIFKELDIPFTASSGNDSDKGKNGVNFPANLDWNIAVGAYNWKDKGVNSNDVTGYSNGGEDLDCVSLTNIYVQNEDGTYIHPYSGTSTSRPWLDGKMGCYIQWRKEHGLPRLTQAMAKKFVRENCIDIKAKGFDYDSGHGLFCLPPTIPEIPKEEDMSAPYQRTTQAIVIHHMGDKLPPDVSILKRWNPYNYDYPEYDFGIEADGTIRIGRPLTIQGAHTTSDKPPYSQWGHQWWNRNTISIGLAGDFTLYPMPREQFNALVSLVKSLMTKYRLTLDEVYPHGQVTYTDCPGCTYSKVPALTKGKWSYDEFERAVSKEEDDVLDVAILLYSKDDYWAGADVADRNGNCAIFVRPADKSAPKDAMSAKKLIVVGGPTVGHANEVLLSGNDRYDTAAAVGKYLG